MRVHVAVDPSGVPRPRTARTDRASAGQAALSEHGTKSQSWGELELAGWSLKVMELAPVSPDETLGQLGGSATSLASMIASELALPGPIEWSELEPLMIEVMALCQAVIAQGPLSRMAIDISVAQRATAVMAEGSS